MVQKNAQVAFDFSNKDGDKTNYFFLEKRD